MSTESVIHEAGQTLKTVVFDYTESNGSNEGDREVEPYSYRVENGQNFFFGYDIRKGGIRKFRPAMIHNIRVTGNSYVPRWPVEV